MSTQATIVTSECVSACVDSDNAHTHLSTLRQCLEVNKFRESIAKSVSISQKSGTTLNFSASNSDTNFYTTATPGTLVLSDYPEGSIITVTVNQAGSADKYTLDSTGSAVQHPDDLKSATVQAIVTKVKDGSLGLALFRDI